MVPVRDGQNLILLNGPGAVGIASLHRRAGNTCLRSRGVLYAVSTMSCSILIRLEHTMTQQCTHLDTIRDVRPNTPGCEECLKTGDTWVHLRMCLHCGHVGCCNSSKNRHATKHFHATRHPIARSIEPGENWAWCYVDELVLDIEK
jgi:Zn-finger in ubiquitin-hydrolases and other protein